MSTWAILGIIGGILLLFLIYFLRIESPGGDRILKYFKEVRNNPVRGEAKILSIGRTFARADSGMVVYEMT